jgi:hypothetical protein
MMNPGDTLEGRGAILQHGRLVAEVDYHLTIPDDLHFFMNPTGRLHFNYEEHLGGFILVAPEDEAHLDLTEYTLELFNKHRKTIQIQRRYKKIKHKGEARISYWVKVVV